MTSEEISVYHDHDTFDQDLLDALHIADKNRGLSTISSSARSCLKGSLRSSGSKRNRRVSFCEQGHACEEFEMYSAEDCFHVWYQGQDYEDMKSSFEFTIFMMDAGCPEKVDDEDEHTTRGLEKRSEEGQWKRYERKRDYYNAVLDEQERQWDEGEEDDPDKIGEIAAQVNRESLMEAYDQGVLDEIAVYGHSLRFRDNQLQLQCQEEDASTADLTLSSSSNINASGQDRDENDSWPSTSDH